MKHLIILLFIFFSFMVISCRNHRDAKTDSDVITFSGLLNVISKDLGNNDFFQHDEVVELLSILQEFDVKESGYNFSQRFNSFGDHSSVCIDRYGNPYLVYFSRCEENNSPGLIPCKTFTVWSPGKNGINEFGNGDDIMASNGELIR